jgi:hypothetical protein
MHGRPADALLGVNRVPPLTSKKSKSSKSQHLPDRIQEEGKVMREDELTSSSRRRGEKGRLAGDLYAQPPEVGKGDSSDLDTQPPEVGKGSVEESGEEGQRAPLLQRPPSLP